MSEIILAAISALAGGGLSSVLFLRLTRQKVAAEAKQAEVGVKKADAEADASELDNVQIAIKIWREMAESLQVELEKSRANYTQVTTEIACLREQVKRLTSINSKILKLLDKLTPENLEKMVEQIKKEIHESSEPNA